MIALGKIVAPHGVRGELKAVAYSGSLEALAGKESVLLRLAGGEQKSFRLLEARPHKGAFIMTLAGVADRDEAQALVGAELVLAPSELPALEEDEYYWFQLIGLRVLTAGGEELGRVAQLMSTGAGADVLVVRRGQRELLIPATPEVVKAVRLAEGTMIIEPPEGLLEA